jgi:hypothetical protein
MSINSKNSFAYLDNSEQSIEVKVEFIDGLTTQNIVSKISGVKNPQVVLWYIGIYGLKEEGMSFYKDFLISPIFNQNAGTNFWLVDLTAWGALKNEKNSISNYSKCTKRLERFLDGQIKCIKSSEFFKNIETQDNLELISYFRKALHREFVSEYSKNFPDNGLFVKDIFYRNRNSALLFDWYEWDTSKAYSVLQYLEGCWLVEQIFSQIIEQNDSSEIQIFFVLPNDENKYYKDKDHSFEKDIRFLLSRRCKELNINNIKIKIIFLSFNYGSETSHRPYNAKGKTMKSSQLSFDMVCKSSEA